MVCGHGCGHSADDPEHVVPGEGVNDLLLSKIDIDNVEILNAQEPDQVKHIFKPWDMRLDEEKFVRSDADEQMIVRIPFTGSVKLRSIIVKGARGESCPTQMKVFSNVPGIDFDSAAVEKPTQVINLVDSKDAVEYPVPATRYPAVTNLTLFFSENAGGETTQVYFIGFKGEFSKRVDRPGQIIYEATPNPADHVKFPGMGNEMHNTLSGQ